MTTHSEPDEPLPPYAFVPGGPWPHPKSAPQGHSAHRSREPEAAAAIVGDDWPRSAEYLRGVVLFNAGYYWEAHECWEALWHAHGRRGPTADLLKALIKVAAAGVKVRERQRHGVVVHAARGALLFASARDQGGRHQLGLDLEEWVARAEAIAAAPPEDPAPPGARVACVFTFQIEPRP